MIKVKDAFRRIGPAPVKRKDTPVPLRNPSSSSSTKMLDKQRSKKKNSNPNTIIEDLEVKEEDVPMNSYRKMDNPGDLSVTENGAVAAKERYNTLNSDKTGDDQSIQQLDSNHQSKMVTFRKDKISKIPESMSSPQIRSSIDDNLVRSPPKLRRSQGCSLRKNSGQKTRSAEDLTILSNRSMPSLDSTEQRNNNQPKSRRSSNKSKRKIIAQSYEPNKLLEKAIEEGYTDLVKSLITSGQVNINKLNSSGIAPLHLAAFEGKDDIVKVLIDHDAYIDILSNTGLTALQAAVMEGNFDSAQLLISNGADQGFVMDGPLNPRVSRDWSVFS